MAVAFDANATADATANAALSISTTNLTVGAGANRALVVQIAWSAVVTSPAMTWDSGGTNQAMAAITNAGATNTNRAELWGLVNPISGAKTLATSWTTARDVYVNGVSWTGVDQTGGATSFPNGTGPTGTLGAAGPNSVPITSAVGDAVMAVHAAPAASWTAVNNTQTFLDNVAAGVSGAGNRAAGAASVTLTGSLGGSGGAWAAAGASIKASSGVAVFVPYQPTYHRAPVMAQ